MWSVCPRALPVPGCLDRLCLIAFLILLKNITTIGYHVDTHRLAKRMDLESCLGQFDIHRDTIIRTEESQAIGGKFLQGLALETLEECQRLCCETDSCDVYIFEDKAEGYCYLFECGPPENFRCKFTRHSNYTSAVLTPIRRITPPPPPTLKTLLPFHPKLLSPGLSQHERELTNLKQKSDSNLQQSKVTTTTISSNAFRSEFQVTTTRSPLSNNSSCRRFQFKCHSGECIAVYNACDGIPQCEDGSDEGPECPTSAANVNKASNSKSVDGLGLTSHISSENIAAIPKQSSIPTMPRQYQQQNMPVSILNNREDPLSAPQLWPGRKIQDLQPDMERNSHIFSHKGGIQLATNNLGGQYVSPNAGIYSPMQRDMYMQPDIQNAYRNVLLQPQDLLIPPPGQNWQSQGPQQSPQPQQIIPANSYVISVNGEPVPQVPQVPQMPVPQQGNNPNNYEELHAAPTKPQDVVAGQKSPISSPIPKTAKNEKGAEKINHKASSEESEEYTDYTEKSTEPPKKKQRKHKKISKDEKTKSKHEKTEAEKEHENPVHEQYKMIKEDLEMEFVDHDGQSERPGGAVLSLTLGIIVTAALAILVGCRMRTVGRRVRRMGKAPYAHDADFLVNGMYL